MCLKQPLIITNLQARHLFLDRQGLSSFPSTKLTVEGLLELVKSLGFVQVDSINTVARAHHMILFARNQTYKPKQLTHLLETDRSVFEHWTHDAAVIPTEFYPYWLQRFKREKVSLLNRYRKWRGEGFEDVLTEILETVTKNGPTLTREVSSKRKKGTGWWDWQPEKTALEFHWRTGNLAIAGRKGFQKIYDVTENVIPNYDRIKQVGQDTIIHWACHTALTRLGVATSGEIAAFWGLVTPKEAAAWTKNNLSKNYLIDVLVEPIGDNNYSKAVAFSDLPSLINNLPCPPKRIRILSPFDPLIRDRKRCLRLFGFDYRIEVFVPKEKRKYGYYVFPLLEGHQFIGRIDMKRHNDTLTVFGLWLEPGIKFGKMRKAALEAELDRHRRFVEAKTVLFALD